MSWTKYLSYNVLFRSDLFLLHWKNYQCHIYYDAFSWIFLKCDLNSEFWEKDDGHSQHLKGSKLRWTLNPVSIYFFSWKASAATQCDIHEVWVSDELNWNEWLGLNFQKTPGTLKIVTPSSFWKSDVCIIIHIFFDFMDLNKRFFAILTEEWFNFRISTRWIIFCKSGFICF